MTANAWRRSLCTVLIGLLAAAALAQTDLGPLRPEGESLGVRLPPVKVMLGRQGLPPYRIAPPADLADRPQTAAFTIRYLNAGEQNAYGDVCVGWPAQAKAAFTAAATIWGALLNSSVPIKINACWANMGTSGILGHGGAADFYQNFQNAPRANTYYPVATANALARTDLNGGDEDIIIAYNNQFTEWYFGTDGNCPGNRVDFMQVILHEMCHGLGFLGSLRSSGGTSLKWGYNDDAHPAIYDQYTENGAGTPLLTFASFSAALYTQATSGNLYFDGPNAKAANGGSRPKLYAPSPWKPGSSYAHLDDLYNGTPHAMMTWSADYGEAIHHPGAITLGMLKDCGWPTGSGPTPPPPPPPVTPGQPLLTDYDGDRRADLGLFRTTGAWRALLSSAGYGQIAFQSIYSGSQFVAVPGDFDGDRLGDPAVLDKSTGRFRFYSSRNGYARYVIPVTWYASGATPTAGDFDGDGRADPIAYVPADGGWHILLSRYGYGRSYQRQWCGAGYQPLCDDFDGDRYGDLMALQIATGYWYILLSRYNYTRYTTRWFGAPGFTPIAGDFDGDRFCDLGAHNRTTGMWYILLSSTDDRSYISGKWTGN